MKKKKIISLIVLLCVLLALIVLYVLVLNYNERHAMEELSETENGESVIPVVSFASADVTGIFYTSDDVEVTLELINGEWRIPDDERFPVDQTLASNMVNGITTLAANRTVDEGALSDYGLDEPVLTIKVTVADSTVHEFLLGDTNSYNDNTYLSVDGKIYMITDTLTDLFDADKDALIAISDKFPGEIDADSVTSITIGTADGKTNVISDDEGVSKFVTDVLKYVNFKNWIGYGLEYGELENYGITEGSPYILLEYGVLTSAEGTTEAKAEFKILFGTDSEGQCYYALPDGNMTYGIAENDYRTLMNYVYYATAESEADETSSVTEAE